MTRSLPSPGDMQNPHLRPMARVGRENNLSWLARAAEGGAADAVPIVLLGGSDRLSRRLRGAQARLRTDLAPSWWSHVLLLHGPPAADAITTEISLAPPAGFGFPPETNAVQHGRLATYRSAAAWPNVALLLLPVDGTRVAEAIGRFPLQRSLVDAPAIVTRWLAYGWGTGGNPMEEGVGIPSAILLETACLAAGFDLTPGMQSHQSCPEAIWQGARWWGDYHESRTGDRPVTGAWVAGETL